MFQTSQRELGSLPFPLEFKNTDPTDDVDPVAAVADLTKAIDEFKASHTGRLDELESKTLRKLVDRLDQVEAKLNRPGPTKAEDETSPERKAFTNFLRYGAERIDPDERKALVISDDTRGGYLAVPEFSREIIKNLVEISPVRRAARVMPTSAASVILPKRTSAPTAVWVGETQTRSETEPAYGQVEIPVNESAAYIDVSIQLLEDAAVDIEAELASDFAGEFGRLEGAAFLTGNSVKKPEGLLINSDVPQVASGAASSVTADALIDAYYALPEAYRSRAVFMANGSTLATCRKLKSGDGAYLWQDTLSASLPPTLLGRPVLEATDMADLSPGSKSIVLGDFSNYRVVDRVNNMSVLRDPYTQATNGKVRFHARRRVGGGVTKAEAFRIVVTATSV